MRHYPVFIDLRGRRVVVAGAGEVAVAKLRLLIEDGGGAGRLRRRARARSAGLGGRRPARARGARTGARATPTALRWSTAQPGSPGLTPGRPRSGGRPARSSTSSTTSTARDFITPAIVDRDPVTVAISTEGAAPVLARKIKAEIEAMLPATLGRLTRIGQGFRARVEALDSRARRAFWTRFYFERGPLALQAGEDAARTELDSMLAEGDAAETRRRASRRRRTRRSRAPDAQGPAPAARGRRRHPRPAGAAGDPRARPARGADRRGRQDALRPLLEAGGDRRAHGCARPAPATAWCGSRAATRPSSAASTRRSRRSRPRACATASCRASPQPARAPPPSGSR